MAGSKKPDGEGMNIQMLGNMNGGMQNMLLGQAQGGTAQKEPF